MQGITLAGFKYLLLHRPAQLWRLLKEYIATAETQGAEARAQGRGSGGAENRRAESVRAAFVSSRADRCGPASLFLSPDPPAAALAPVPQGVAVVSFLLRLGFLTQGAAYPLSELPPAEQAVARDMQLLGLLYFVGDGADQWFFSTPLAATATSELVDRDGSGGGESHGYIIVETNFHLYAYTSSPLVRAGVGRLGRGGERRAEPPPACGRELHWSEVGDRGCVCEWRRGCRIRAA